MSMEDLAISVELPMNSVARKRSFGHDMSSLLVSETDPGLGGTGRLARFLWQSRTADAFYVWAINPFVDAVELKRKLSLRSLELSPGAGGVGPGVGTGESIEHGLPRPETSLAIVDLAVEGQTFIYLKSETALNAIMADWSAEALVFLCRAQLSTNDLTNIAKKDTRWFRFDNRSWQRTVLDLHLTDPSIFYASTHASLEILGSREAVVRALKVIITP